MDLWEFGFIPRKGPNIRENGLELTILPLAQVLKNLLIECRSFSMKKAMIHCTELLRIQNFTKIIILSLSKIRMEMFWSLYIHKGFNYTSPLLRADTNQTGRTCRKLEQALCKLPARGL